MTDSVFKSSFSLVSIRRDSALLLEKVTRKSQWQHTHTYTYTYTHTYTNEHALTYSYTDTHIHTHSSQPTDVCGLGGSCTCTIWNMQPLGQEKERDWRVTLGRFRPPLRGATGDTAHASLATVRHRGVEMQLFDEHHCLSRSFSRAPESSAVSFFSPWRSFLGTALCRDWTCSDPPEWDLKAFSTWLLGLLCL